ncbi:MAG: hypothetical protein JSW08_00580 [archaeon]|nr:MAG: hypothetical protein JSW08_00580 [archaeon]
MGSKNLVLGVLGRGEGEHIPGKIEKTEYCLTTPLNAVVQLAKLVYYRLTTTIEDMRSINYIPGKFCQSYPIITRGPCNSLTRRVRDFFNPDEENL